MIASAAKKAPSAVKKAAVGVVWFRGTDLRTKDNAVLLQAHRDCEKVAHLFCLDPRNFRTTRLGYEKTSIKRLAFLVDSLLDLKSSLRGQGGDLDVVIGRPEDVIEKYVTALVSDSSNSSSGGGGGGGSGGGKPASKDKNYVYCFDEVAHEEKTVLREVSSRLNSKRLPFEVISAEFWAGGTLLTPSDLNFDIKDLGFFTAFRKKVEGSNLITPQNLPMAPDWPEKGVGAKKGFDVSTSTLGALELELARLDDIPTLWSRLRDLGSREIESYGARNIGGCASSAATDRASKEGKDEEEDVIVFGASSDEDILPDVRTAVPFTNLRCASSSRKSSESSGSGGGGGGVDGLGGGERAALRRVDHYITQGRGRLSLYKQTRNGMIGADYSSKLSVYLSLGNISARYVLREIKEFERKSGIADENTYWLVFELLWRDYMHFYMYKYGRKLFYLGGIRDDKTKHPWGNDTHLLDLWRRGHTGYPLVDANMRELHATGFMSNRGRQIVASFLVRDLKQDWRHGAEWFESQLLDHDVCSNWGNWQYSAGIGADPREDRYFNVVKQGNDYDPNAEYIKLWLPEIKSLPNRVVLDPRLLTDAMRVQYGVSESVYPRIAVRLGMESFPQAAMKPKPNSNQNQNQRPGSSRDAGGAAGGSNTHTSSSNKDSSKYSNVAKGSNIDSSRNNSSNISSGVKNGGGGGGVGGGRIDVIMQLSNPNYNPNTSPPPVAVQPSVTNDSVFAVPGEGDSNKRSKKQQKKHEHGLVPGRL